MDTLPDITPFQYRLDELAAQMAEPSFYANARKATEISREQQALRQMIEDHPAYERAGLELAEHAALIRDQVVLLEVGGIAVGAAYLNGAAQPAL